MVVGDLKLEVGAVVRIVWSCVNRELYFLWRLSQKSLEGKMSNVGGHSFGGVVMWADSLMDFFLFDGSCLGEVTGSTKEVVVVEMVLMMVESVVLAGLGVLLEVLIFLQLMVWGWKWEMVVGVMEGVL